MSDENDFDDEYDADEDGDEDGVSLDLSDGDEEDGGDDDYGGYEDDADDDDDDDYGGFEDDDDDDDDYGGYDDDDDDDDYDDYNDDDDYDDDGGDGVPIGLIALIASSLVLILALGGIVGWLAFSFDEEAYAEARKPVTVTAKLGPPPSPPKAKKKAVPVQKVPTQKAVPPKSPEETEKAPKTAAAGKTTGGAKPAKGDARMAAVMSGATKGASDTVKSDVKMAAVDPEMIDETTSGPLPKIAPDGRQAWQVYARPFTKPEAKKPLVAVIVAGLGLSQAPTQSAIQQLPGAVTLAFVPYAKNLGDWIAQARAAGHEVLLELPMEPADYPNSDPGPHTLLTSIPAEENMERLNWLLGRFPGYVGVTNYMGAKFTASETHMQPVLQALKERGLLYLDARANRKSVAARVAKEIDMPRAANNRFIDREASRVSIDARLYELERIAKSVGTSVGIAFPFPVTVERLSAWIAGMEKKGLVLAPLTAVANTQPIR